VRLTNKEPLTLVLASPKKLTPQSKSAFSLSLFAAFLV